MLRLLDVEVDVDERERRRIGASGSCLFEVAENVIEAGRSSGVEIST